MPKKKEEISINYLLHDINVKNFSIEELKPHGKAEKINFNFDFNTQLSFSKKNKFVQIGLSIACKTEFTIAKMESIFTYKVEDMERFAEPNNRFNFPDTFIAIIIGLSISTSRGVWFEKTRGTIIHKIFLPILDPRAIAEDIKKSSNPT